MNNQANEDIASEGDLQRFLNNIDIDKDDQLQILAKERTRQFFQCEIKSCDFTICELGLVINYYYQAYYDSAVKFDTLQSEIPDCVKLARDKIKERIKQLQAA